MDIRHEMFEEAVEIIRALFGGDYVNYHGKHYRVDSAKLYDIPAQPVRIGMAAFGPRAARLTARYGDMLVSDQPLGEIAELFRNEGGAGKPAYGQIPVAFGDDYEECKQRAHRIWKFSAPAWKVMAELPGPVNFEAATKTVRPEDVAESVPCGDNIDDYVQAVQQWADAGFTHVSFCQSGPDRQKESAPGRKPTSCPSSANASADLDNFVHPKTRGLGVRIIDSVYSTYNAFSSQPMAPFPLLAKHARWLRLDGARPVDLPYSLLQGANGRSKHRVADGPRKMREKDVRPVIDHPRSFPYGPS